jgi:hypothetical protein
VIFAGYSELLAGVRGIECHAKKRAARRAFTLFLQDPGHNSLQFKKLRGYPDYWSVRVSQDVRVVGKRRGDAVEWAWIGTHNEFDKLFS